MKTATSSLSRVWITVGPALVLWFLTFGLPLGNFWLKISISAAILAVIAIILNKPGEPPMRFNFRAAVIGLVSAVILYGIFRIGQTVSHLIFDFSKDQIGSIYALGRDSPRWMIVLLLFFITGPAEEFFWRGFLQHRLAGRFGGCRGWLLASAIYAAVHICSLNFMLVGAAAVAGLFWGLLYWRLGNLAPVMISHAVWSTGIFVFFPIM